MLCFSRVSNVANQPEFKLPQRLDAADQEAATVTKEKQPNAPVEKEMIV